MFSLNLIAIINLSLPFPAMISLLVRYVLFFSIFFSIFFFNFFSPWSKKLVSALLVMTPIYFQILTIQPTLHNLQTGLDVCHLQAVFKILCTTNGLVLASVQGKKYNNCLQSSLLEIEIGVDIPWQKVLQFFNFKYPSQWVKNLNIVLK